MQQANVLGPVQGEELGNCVFLRRGAAVLEILSFAYHMRHFQGLMDMFHSVHEPVYSAPDADAFQSCVDREVARKPNYVLRRGRGIGRLRKDRAELFRQAEGDADRDAAPDCALMVRILRCNQQATA